MPFNLHVPLPGPMSYNKRLGGGRSLDKAAAATDAMIARFIRATLALTVWGARWMLALMWWLAVAAWYFYVLLWRGCRWLYRFARTRIAARRARTA